MLFTYWKVLCPDHENPISVVKIPGVLLVLDTRPGKHKDAVEALFTAVLSWQSLAINLLTSYGHQWEEAGREAGWTSSYLHIVFISARQDADVIWTPNDNL